MRLFDFCIGEKELVDDSQLLSASEITVNVTCAPPREMQAPKKEGLKAWHIILIVVGSVAILGGAGAFIYFRQ